MKRTDGNTLSLSLDETRTIAVHSSGLAAGFAGVAGALAGLVAVQLDTINVVGRAHELTLASRAPGLNVAQVSDALWGASDEEPVAFEYWAHAASLIPVADWPLWGFRMRRTRAAGIDWRPPPAMRTRILDMVADQGPLTMRQLRGGEKAGRGWSWGTTKTAVEYLVWSGEMVCVRRQGWNRVFDLPERAIPADILDQSVDDHAGVVELLTRAGQALGVATDDDLADYLRLRAGDVRAAVGETVLRPVRVHGWRQLAWAHPDALSALDRPPDPVARFVGPFDNLIWYRRRVARLFEFDHLLEAYKPAAKRRYGYYVLPLLAGTRLVGRADVRIEDSALHVLTLSVDSVIDPMVATEALRSLMAVTATSRVVLPTGS